MGHASEKVGFSAAAYGQFFEAAGKLRPHCFESLSEASYLFAAGVRLDWRGEIAAPHPLGGVGELVDGAEATTGKPADKYPDASRN